jgi:Domain of unknown function (DUF1905)/Bacteriocin-protection, YdeI or OmpD-Associated
VKQRFSAVIYKQGINPCIDIPERIAQSLLRKGYIAVRVSLNDHPFRATLAPVGNDQYRLYINGAMRKAANVDVEDKIRIALELDTQRRTIPIPEAFKKALEQNPKASTEFKRLTPSRRKDILLYMNALKRPESLQKVIDRVVKSLTAEN